MDMILLLVLLLILIAPSFFMMRKQRRRQNEMTQMQANLQVGQRVVTASGMHATIVGLEGDQVALEIAPDVITTWERIAVIRTVDEENPELVGGEAVAAQYGQNDADYAETDYPDADYGDAAGHPENDGSFRGYGEAEGPETEGRTGR
ncbi:preprotein translocase subunit YajC [Corynebacterium sp. MSK006]|uniref:preprotein translocase subunit YajC n=1 Tax=Corynebacterium TaxID=1716 RepID=UPI00254A0C86|nr:MULTISPECIES: preprotein translocase subunit YajC [Corynebacterium]MDK8894739.1 preprotein translocase subunit YajC [Corynebacterium sp. MSK006]